VSAQVELEAQAQLRAAHTEQRDAAQRAQRQGAHTLAALQASHSDVMAALVQLNQRLTPAVAPALLPATDAAGVAGALVPSAWQPLPQETLLRDQQKILCDVRAATASLLWLLSALLPRPERPS